MTRRAVLIPADLALPLFIVDVTGDYRTIAKAIGASYVERVRITLTPSDHLTMAVDEEGLNTDKRANPRASRLYSGSLFGWPIRGDVLIMREAYVGDGLDWVDLVDADAALKLVEASIR